jgi:hypothetical protein
MTTIYSISPNGQERIDTVQSERIAEKIKRLQNQGQLKIKVI